MSIVYIDEYEPSSASLQLQDPIYKVSQSQEQIQVGKLQAPAPWLYLLPILVVGGIAVAWWLTKKS